MKRGVTGEFVTISTTGGVPAKAFIPLRLPPSPPLEFTSELRSALDEALVAIGRLDSVTTLLPDVDLFIYTYVRKEAVLSSQIEGTQSSLSDLLLFEMNEAPGVPLDDVVEVSNYVAALTHGLDRLHEEFPISNRLIREIHEVLLSKGRGADKQPGEFRGSQVWIGGATPQRARFVPPPPEYVEDCMAALEQFLHDVPERTSTILKAALAHAQFETIHPFLDGNGRVGRLLITLIFCAEGLLNKPLLYLSLYFKQHREQYYDLLNQLRAEGNWEAWIAFFADAVRETAQSAVDAAQQLAALFQSDRERIETLGRAASSALRVHEQLQSRPITTIAFLSKATAISVPTITKSVNRLEQLGIIKEMSGRRRNRVYAYSAYLDLLMQET